MTVSSIAGRLIVIPFVAHQKHLEREQAKKYERENTLNEYFGELGKREVFVLTVLAALDMQSDYGAMTLYKFRDADGRPAVWFSSGSKNPMEIGTTYTVKAKKHELYNGQKQTTLSRLVAASRVRAAIGSLCGCFRSYDGPSTVADSH
jgi:hypothetical protein